MFHSSQNSNTSSHLVFNDPTLQAELSFYRWEKKKWLSDWFEVSRQPNVGGWIWTLVCLQMQSSPSLPHSAATWVTMKHNVGRGQTYSPSPHRNSSLTVLDPPVACPRFWDPRVLSHPFPGQWCTECLCPRPVKVNKDVRWKMQKKILINLLEIPVWVMLLHCQWIKCFTSSKRACLVLVLLSMYTTTPLPPAQHTEASSWC